MPEAPNDLKWNLSLRLAAQGENVPDQVRGRPVLSQSVLWTGDPEQGRRYLDRALSFGKPVEVASAAGFDDRDTGLGRVGLCA